jgi:putative DNA primase/helicase
MIDLRAIARVLGGDVVGHQVLAPGPGHSDGDRSLAIRLSSTAPDGFVCHSHAGDDWQTCRDHVRRKLGLPDWQPGDEQDRRVHRSRVRAFDRMAVDRESEKRPLTDDDLARIERAVAIWHDGIDPQGTLAQTYLNVHRKLELGDDLAGTVLRFHPRCPWRNENTGNTDRVPALIAAFRSVDDGTITAIHRIRLNADGTKAGRRMLGVVHRAAVKFDGLEGEELVIGEGIETCMAARQLGYRPAWALGSVGAISFFPLLEGVKRLIILGEAGNASEQAIKMCGRRWSRAGRRVRIAYSEIGCDINDALMGSSP